MKWVKFDYSKFKVKNGVEYFVLVQNMKNNEKYYHHIQGRNDTIFMTNSDADYEFNWNYNEHRILFIMELPKGKEFESAFRKDKIERLLKK